MPPMSRGLRTFSFFGRYLSSSAPSSKPGLSKLPPPLPKTEASSPNGAHASPASDAQEIPGHGPSAPYGPLRAPPGPPPLAVRLKMRFSGPVWTTIRLFLRLLPWLPPLLLLAYHSPYQIMWVNGPSMTPYLNTNYSSETPNTEDRVLVRRFRDFRNRTVSAVEPGHICLQRGMIVVFRTPHDPNKIAVKRIVGVAGDRVRPRPGYPGGPGKVIVPYNHLWVEGDVESRDKSVDSNWYGPISQNLVIGYVKFVLSPWYRPSLVNWQQHGYPAKLRVEDNAMHQLHPDEQTDPFKNGTAERVLQSIKQHPGRLQEMQTKRKEMEHLAFMLHQSQQEIDKGDPATVALATEIVERLEPVVTGINRLRQPDSLQEPGADAIETATMADRDR